MIDIVFNLLVFFLVATRFGAAEGILAGRLPSASAAQTVFEVPAVPIRVRLAAAEQGGCVISIDDRTTRPSDFDQLARLLETIQGEPGYDNQTPVVLVAGPDVAWDHVVNAYNAAVRTRYENIVFGSD
jgi:biopolymer transport protein ExbD